MTETVGQIMAYIILDQFALTAGAIIGITCSIIAIYFFRDFTDIEDQ